MFVRECGSGYLLFKTLPLRMTQRQVVAITSICKHTMDKSELTDNRDGVLFQPPKQPINPLSINIKAT